MQFTIVDGVVVLVVLVSAFLAYSRGFTRELFALGGWIVAGAAGLYFAPTLSPLMQEIPAVGEILAGQCVIAMVAAFALIVALGLLVMSVFTPLFSSWILQSALAPVDRALGFLFGVARAVVILAIVYVIYQYTAPQVAWPPLENAATRVVFEDAANRVEASLPEEVPGWFEAQTRALLAPCQAPGSPPSVGQES